MCISVAAIDPVYLQCTSIKPNMISEPSTVRPAHFKSVSAQGLRALRVFESCVTANQRSAENIHWSITSTR